MQWSERSVENISKFAFFPWKIPLKTKLFPWIFTIFGDLFVWIIFMMETEIHQTSFYRLLASGNIWRAHSGCKNLLVTEVLPEPLGPAMIINSGLYTSLVIDNAVYAFSPLLSFGCNISAHLFKTNFSRLLAAFASFLRHLFHYLAEHFVTWLFTGSESV